MDRPWSDHRDVHADTGACQQRSARARTQRARTHARARAHARTSVRALKNGCFVHSHLHAIRPIATNNKINRGEGAHSNSHPNLQQPAPRR